MPLGFILAKIQRQESINPGGMVRQTGLLLTSAMPPSTASADERRSRLLQRQENQRKTLKYLPLWFRAKNLTQRTIAEHLEIAEASLSKWLSGKDQMPMGVLRQMAALVGVHEADLLRDPLESENAARIAELVKVMAYLTRDEVQVVLSVAGAIQQAKGKGLSSE